jgi:amidohydrolase
MYGARYEMNYRRGVPSVQNDPKMTQLVTESVGEAWGKESIITLAEPSLGAEDFSVYLNHAPGMMFRLGVGHPKAPNYPLHHPKFEIDESAIITGVVTLAYSAYKYWQNNQ